jgi:hypothetical protein
MGEKIPLQRLSRIRAQSHYGRGADEPAGSHSIPCDQILAIHKAVGYSPAGAKIGGTVNSADMLPIGKAVQA